MLHAATSAIKTAIAQGKSQLAPSSRQKLHPFLPDIGSQHTLIGDVGNTIPNHAPGAQ